MASLISLARQRNPAYDGRGRIAVRERLGHPRLSFVDGPSVTNILHDNDPAVVIQFTNYAKVPHPMRPQAVFLEAQRLAEVISLGFAALAIRSSL
jgi:hypothetical protein